MSKDLVLENGEILDITGVAVQPVTVIQPAIIKFKTNYTNNMADGDAEINSGEYIVDDSQYIDFKKLLQRSAKCEKSAIDFLSQIGVVDNVGGVSVNEVDSMLNNDGMPVSEVQSTELSTGELSNPTVQESSNPVENSPDVTGVAETNGE